MTAEHERLHPDADAGISRFLAVFAATGLMRELRVGSKLKAPHVPTTFNGHTGPLMIDALPLLIQLEKASSGQVELALRPLFGAALSTGYEALKTKAGLRRDDDRPVVQFFRHIRNGISHGNVFNILGKEPIKSAKWRGLEITKELHGKVVLYRFLRPADALRLINDAYTEVLGT